MGTYTCTLSHLGREDLCTAHCHDHVVFIWCYSCVLLVIHAFPQGLRDEPTQSLLQDLFHRKVVETSHLLGVLSFLFFL